MEFQDFPRFPGKSGKYEIHPPKRCTRLDWTDQSEPGGMGSDAASENLHTKRCPAVRDRARGSEYAKCHIIQKDKSESIFYFWKSQLRL